MLRWCYTGVFIENAVPSTGPFPRIHNIDKDIFRACVLSYAVAVEHGFDKGLGAAAPRVQGGPTIPDDQPAARLMALRREAR